MVKVTVSNTRVIACDVHDSQLQESHGTIGFGSTIHCGNNAL